MPSRRRPSYSPALVTFDTRQRMLRDGDEPHGIVHEEALAVAAELGLPR
jgi:hypothetical protein